jgi:dolichol-phosphate mannosyltransferase
LLGVKVDLYSDLTVVIPTLNEDENIKILLGLLQKGYPGISVIVADDGSTDKTQRYVLEASKRNRRIKLLDRSRKKHGLTASVLDAVIIVRTGKMILMDGDLQHPWQKIGEITKALDHYELVIGVRTKVESWGIERRLLSFFMSGFAYTVFTLRGKQTCGDMMSGFFGIRTALFRSIIKNNKERFVGSGYKVLLDTLRIMDGNIKIDEVKYSTFQNRKYGKSKLSGLGINHASDTIRSILG